MGYQLVTANRLHDGEVVYLTAEGGWSEDLQDARLEGEGEAQAALLAAGEAAEVNLKVVGPYLMPAERDDRAIRPTSQREKIRAAGPSTRLDLGKQAVAETSGV